MTITLESTLQDAVERAIKESGDDARAATTILLNEVKRNRKLREQLTEPLLRSACYDRIRSAFRVERKQIWFAPNYDATQGSERAKAHGEYLLMQFRLPAGKRLSEATIEDLLEASEFYSKQASDMAHKGRWLDLIAKGLKKGKTVGKQYNEATLRALQEEARND